MSRDDQGGRGHEPKGPPGVRVTAKHWVEARGTGSRATLSMQFFGFLGPLVAHLTRGLNDRYLAIEAMGLKGRSGGLSRDYCPSTTRNGSDAL